MIQFTELHLPAQDQSKALDAATRFVNTQMTRADAVSTLLFDPVLSAQVAQTPPPPGLIRGWRSGISSRMIQLQFK